MSWNNVEKHFKNKMDERRISPSDDAWQQLDAMLNIAQKSKSKKMYYSLAIACSVIGIGFVGIYMMTQKTTVNKSDTLMVTQKNEEPNDSTKTTDKPKNERVINPTKTLKPVTKLAENTPKNVPKNGIIKTLAADIDASLGSKNHEPIVANLDIENLTISNINNRINADELLKSVDKQTPNNYNNTPIKVNANALLSHADTELSKSFTEKALQTLHKNYHNLKETIALRNIKEE